MFQLKIRQAGVADLPRLAAISQATAFAAQWTEQQWRDIFHTQIPPRLAWLALAPEAMQASSSDGPESAAIANATPPPALPAMPLAAPPGPLSQSPRAIGFLVAQCGGPEWELENMAVLPGFRRSGTGSALLSALLSEARARGAERILLEVRLSNLPAIRLYGQGGFKLLARRPGYYRDPAEDALIMVREL